MATNGSAERLTSYESFFGFFEAPFGLVPNTRFRFDSASHQMVLDQVTYALQRREPVVVVTGEIGTGKTLLCRTVVERLDRKTFLSIINDPLLGRDDLLKQMLQDFGIISADRTKVKATSRADLVHAVNEFLSSLAQLDAHAILIIDEAQHVQPEVLEEIRLLSNVQDDRGTMLQIILVGQPGLDALLARPELAQVKHRVTRHLRLESMSAGEVAKYIAHRLAVAREAPGSTRPGARELQRALADWQGSTLDVRFEPDAIDRIARLSRGVPRIVNLLCDRALESAFAAKSYVVDVGMVDAAARALGIGVEPAAAAAAVAVAPAAEPAGSAAAELPPPAPKRRRLGLVGAVVVVIAAAAIWFGARAGMGTSPAATSPGTAPAVSSAPPSTTPSSPAAAAPAAGAVSTTAPSAATAPPPTQTPTPPAPAGSAATRPAAAAPAGESFEIVIASFRTDGRAKAVASEVAALGQPVRQREANGWQQVLAGPFTSRTQAEDAQERLRRAGFGDTQIVPGGR